MLTIRLVALFDTENFRQWLLSTHRMSHQRPGRGWTRNHGEEACIHLICQTSRCPISVNFANSVPNAYSNALASTGPGGNTREFSSSQPTLHADINEKLARTGNLIPEIISKIALAALNNSLGSSQPSFAPIQSSFRQEAC